MWWWWAAWPRASWPPSTGAFPGTPYAFQDQPLGTGDAARKGAELLERMRFDGNVLVVAGDKVIDPKVIRQLLAAHEQSRADVTLATAKRPPNSSAGILLKSARGNIVGILEEAERRRLVALAKINEAFRTAGGPAPRDGRGHSGKEVRGEDGAGGGGGDLGRESSPKSEVQVGRQVQPALGPLPEERAGRRRALTREEFERRFSKEERLGCLKVGEETVPASRMLERFDQMNMSTYLFRAPVLYDALSRLKSARASQEEYLTDVFEILAKRQKPARVMGCEVQDARDLMAFNNPQELLAIEEVYRQRQGQAVVEAPSIAWRDAGAGGRLGQLAPKPLRRGAPAVPAMVWGGGSLAANPQCAGRLHAAAMARTGRWRSCARRAGST